jgi:hypothetical protein
MPVLDMKIAFFSEGNFIGTPKRTDLNLRMPEVWYASLNATHYPITSLHDVPSNSYDIGIIIIPKQLHHLTQYPIVNEMRRCCEKIAFQQEGASWLFQDYEVDIQVWFYTLMMSMDFGLCHTERDKSYYESALGIPIYVHPTLMLEDPIINISKRKTSDKTIIGGNLVRYYGGFNSYLIAHEFNNEIWAPSMGRKKTSESLLSDLNHLPWMTWHDWMVSLSEMKYAVHLNPNTIAGSFNNNCAYWGIPCIGNIYCDTQRLNFPELSIEPDDLYSARNLARKLKEDNDFYLHCSNKAKELYQLNFSEDSYKQAWHQIITQVYSHKTINNE